MDHTTPALLIRDKRRAWRDRLTRYVVSTGGMVVLAMLMLIFVYLLVAVWPLVNLKRWLGHKMATR